MNSDSGPVRPVKEKKVSTLKYEFDIFKARPHPHTTQSAYVAGAMAALRILATANNLDEYASMHMALVTEALDLQVNGGLHE